MKRVCVLVVWILLFFLITQICTFDLLTLKNYALSLLSFTTVSQLKKKQNRKTLITLFSKAAQLCDNRWAKTLKQAKSGISRLSTGWLFLRLHRSPGTADGPREPRQAGGLRETQHRPDDPPWMRWVERVGAQGSTGVVSSSGVGSGLAETSQTRPFQ